MKAIKAINGIFYSLFMIAVFSTALQLLFNIPFVITAFSLAVPSFLVKGILPSNGLIAGIYREAFTSEMVKRFNASEAGTWRNGIKDLGRYMSMLQDGETVIINLTYFGVSPDVLINNTSYPIAIQALDGENIAVTINKFQTKATPITDDEIFGLNYDKIRAVQEAHAIKIIEDKDAMGIHNITPATNTANTPILVTTGADDGTGRKMLTKADVLLLRKKWNDLKIPMAGRRLVFCNDHVNDILTSNDQKFKDQYYDYTSGILSNLFGFELFEYPTMPYIHATNLTKLSFGGTVTSNHNVASTAFHLARIVQAKGYTKAYLSPASQDPQYQRNLLNYRHYDIVTPYKAEGYAAIVSGKVE